MKDDIKEKLEDAKIRAEQNVEGIKNVHNMEKVLVGEMNQNIKNKVESRNEALKEKMEATNESLKEKVDREIDQRKKVHDVEKVLVNEMNTSIKNKIESDNEALKTKIEETKKKYQK